MWRTIPAGRGRPKILDIGCGYGAQTRALAQLTGGRIVAVDNHQPFVDEINHWAVGKGCGARIRAVCASMDDLPFREGEFDIIWSEGAIDIMGFEKGLAAWQKFLKKGGCMVISAMALFDREAPAELIEYLTKQGVVPLTEDVLAGQVTPAGLELLKTDRLEKEGWTTNYYEPMRKVIAELRPTHGQNEEDAAVLDGLDEEASIYDKYGDSFGYTFFLMRKS
jgi:cyclopropane fatty-acyl-phospholipid synthase-like methyltransferase